MSRGSTRALRRIVLGTEWNLEGRLNLSTIVPSTRLLATAEISALVHGKDELLGRETAETHAATRVAHPLCHSSSATHALATPQRWSWLANTYWYVPKANVMAVVANSATGTVSSITDQTVFHITNYQDGYFWGDVEVQYGQASPASVFLVGSVTPEGKVLLTFTYGASSSSPSITFGYGTMEKKLGQWTMANQMFTSPTASVQIGHWAYMMQTNPSKPSWHSLPAVGVSVPEFFNE